jgi:hypothetical protein
LKSEECEASGLYGQGFPGREGMRIVSNTGPIIGLAKIGLLFLLNQLPPLSFTPVRLKSIIQSFHPYRIIS